MTKIPEGLWKVLEKRVLKLMLKGMRNKGITIPNIDYVGSPDVWGVGRDNEERMDIVVDGNIEIPKEWVREADPEEFETLKKIIKEYL